MWSLIQQLLLISGGLCAQRLPAQKGGFLSQASSHVAASVWARAEPIQYHLPPKAHPKSFPLRNSKHIYLHVYPFRVRIHRFIHISFVFHLFNEDAKLHWKTPFYGTQNIYICTFKTRRVWFYHKSHVYWPRSFVLLQCDIAMRYVAIAYHIVLRPQ